MAENKQTPVVIDNVTYYFEDMTQDQQMYVNHLSDLDRKINNARFNLDQLSVGQQAYIALLKGSLEASAQQATPPSDPVPVDTSTADTAPAVDAPVADTAPVAEAPVEPTVVAPSDAPATDTTQATVAPDSAPAVTDPAANAPTNF
jgi:hypothetical protein